MRITHYTSRVDLVRREIVGIKSTKVKEKIREMKLTPPQKRLLRKLAIRQKDLAEKVGLDKRQVSMVLTGDRRTPHIQEKIAKAAGMSVEELFGRWAWTKIYKRRPAERRGLASVAGGGRVKAQRNGRGNGHARPADAGASSHAT